MTCAAGRLRRLEAPGTQVEVPGTQVEVPGTQVEVPGTQVEVPGTQARASMDGRCAGSPENVAHYFGHVAS